MINVRIVPHSRIRLINHLEIYVCTNRSIIYAIWDLRFFPLPSNLYISASNTLFLMQMNRVFVVKVKTFLMYTYRSCVPVRNYVSILSLVTECAVLKRKRSTISMATYNKEPTWATTTSSIPLLCPNHDFQQHFPFLFISLSQTYILDFIISELIL